MKGGINFADKITNCKSYLCKEIQTSFYGEELDGLLKKSHNYNLEVY